jgi:hypothetical protein
MKPNSHNSFIQEKYYEPDEKLPHVPYNAKQVTKRVIDNMGKS